MGIAAKSTSSPSRPDDRSSAPLSHSSGRTSLASSEGPPHSAASAGIANGIAPACKAGDHSGLDEDVHEDVEKSGGVEVQILVPARMNIIEDQPAPIARPDRVPVWDLVIADLKRLEIEEYGEPEPGDEPEEIHARILADMEARDRLGRERYGTPLTTGNGRDHLVDAYQEALDFCVYLRAFIEEHPLAAESNPKRRLRIRDVKNLYIQHLHKMWHLRWVMAELAEVPA
jgi:hypothetical protein